MRLKAIGKTLVSFVLILTMLMSSALAYEELAKGSKGNAVIELQERLNELGYSVGTADGDYGGKTVRAVAEFQLNNAMSSAFLKMAGVFSELELQMIRARVRSGMANAAIKGKHIGRPQTTKDDIPAVFYKHYPAFMAGTLNVSELARVCGLSRPTVYKYLRLVG